MASNSKKAKTVTIGGIVLVAAILLSKLLGGPDLTSLLLSDGRSLPTSVPPREAAPGTAATTAADGESAIRALINTRTSGEMVELHAEIVKLLPDDNEGSRHQRILLELKTGGTMLVAHNIDLAERIPAEEGDWITVYGQYEWNDKGGVLHWTHHDPKNWREGGWIEHAGVRYE
ncbi:MAG: DUF3465 domain-containing protein [Planctomycetota bacterium]